MQQSRFSQAPRSHASAKYNAARSNLLVVCAFTTMNIIMAALGSSWYMLFTATVPYICAGVGRAFYLEYDMPVLLVIAFIIAVILTIPYLVFWKCSKKHYGWMIAALVYFSLDCVVLLFSFDVNIILDIVFHIWVMYHLIAGVKYGSQLKDLPEDPVPEVQDQDADSPNSELPDTPALRTADEAKHRVLASADCFGHKIELRKVGRCDELVVDGMVYAEYPYPSRIVRPHTLIAYVNGMKITAGLTVINYFIAVNDMEFARSVKWI